MLSWLLLSSAFASGQVVVSAAPDADLTDPAVVSARPLVRGAGKARHRLGHLRVLKVTGDPEEVAGRLATKPGVRYAVPDGMGFAGALPDDPYFGTQWGLRNDGTYTDDAVAGADIDAPGAWDIQTGSPQIVIAVIDTGGPMDEPDLGPNLWENPAESDNGQDDDDNGYVDDLTGWDFTSSTNDTRDVYGHGSSVAGIAAAVGNNGRGYSGVCWGCSVMVLQGLDDDSWGYYSWWAEAITYAVDNGASVVNLSLGGTDTSGLEPLQEAVEYALDNGVVVVVCMMNDDDDAPYYPAAFDGVIAVGATDPADRRASPFSWGGGSNYGDHIDVVAPGAEIYGLSPNRGEYGEWSWSGTSQAAPHVAGIAGLLLSQDPQLTPGEVKALLEDSAVDGVGRPTEDVDGWDRYHGWGRADAKAALDLLAERPHDPNADTDEPEDTGGEAEIPLSCACDAAAGPRSWGVLALLGLLVTRARRPSR
jgi:thermitase